MNDETDGRNLTVYFKTLVDIEAAALDFINSWNSSFTAQKMVDAFSVGFDISAESEECTPKELKAWRDSNLVGGGKGRQARMRNKFNGRSKRKAAKK